MKSFKNSFRAALIILMSLFLVGCSSNNNLDNTESPDKTTKSWIQIWDGQSENEAEAAYRSFSKSSDEFTKQYTLDLPDSEKSQPKREKTNLNFNLYSDKDSNFAFLPTITLIYYGDDWKFYKSIMFKFGNEVREFRSSETPLREVESGYVLEIVNYFLTTEDVDFLSKVFTFGEPELRINKDSGLYTEMKLSAVELNNLKKVLLAYKYIVNSKIQP
jgi:hypothetical protein